MIRTRQGGVRVPRTRPRIAYAAVHAATFQGLIFFNSPAVRSRSTRGVASDLKTDPESVVQLEPADALRQCRVS
jgi:hypothetical protein